jgi:hypothetical protein
MTAQVSASPGVCQFAPVPVIPCQAMMSGFAANVASASTEANHPPAAATTKPSATNPATTNSRNIMVSLITTPREPE